VKLKIDGKEYDIEAAMERPTLFLIREMKIRTGYGIKSLMDAGKQFKGKATEEILDDPDLLGAFIAMIWLARRSAGEQLTFEQAGSFDLESAEFVNDAPELPAPGDDLPKAPATDSAPADGRHVQPVPGLSM
jgi:hypothetical protein